MLSSDFDGDIPDSVEGLCGLPGVGPKMAHLCMNIAWKKQSGIGENNIIFKMYFNVTILLDNVRGRCNLPTFFFYSRANTDIFLKVI